MKTFCTLSLIACFSLFVTSSAFAQENKETNSKTISSFKAIHDITSDFVIATAEMLDEDMYAYRPTVNVRTVSQQLIHIANAQFGVCSTAMGEDSPAQPLSEDDAVAREEILSAVKKSFEYCENVYARMTDKKLKEVKPFFGGDRRQDMTVLGILSFNATHTYEHYGQLVTYMRLNGITPPSSM